MNKRKRRIFLINFGKNWGRSFATLWKIYLPDTCLGFFFFKYPGLVKCSTKSFCFLNKNPGHLIIHLWYSNVSNFFMEPSLVYTSSNRHFLHIVFFFLPFQFVPCNACFCTIYGKITSYYFTMFLYVTKLNKQVKDLRRKIVQPTWFSIAFEIY